MQIWVKHNDRTFNAHINLEGLEGKYLSVDELLGIIEKLNILLVRADQGLTADEF